jgi:RHS repeat-associated protein
VVTDQANRVVWRWDGANPFGAALPDEDPDGDGVRFTLNLRFPGQYYDRETGLHYNYYRDYDPSTGRYIESDPIGLAGGINTYAYAKNSPLSLTDPRGLKVQRCCRKAEILGGLVSHCWIKTDTVTAGMASNPQCRAGVGDNFEPPYTTKVYVSDHSCEKPGSCEDVDDVDEDCVNKELTVGKALGRFDLANNNCQTFVHEVLKKCSKKKKPFTESTFWR